MSLHTLGQKNAEDRLIIFDRFRVDKKLPKFPVRYLKWAGSKGWQKLQGAK